MQWIPTYYRLNGVMLLKDIALFPVGISNSCLYASQYLKKSGMTLIDHISPEITQTDAPKRRDVSGGVLRVVYASDDGTRLTGARFLDPIAE